MVFCWGAHLSLCLWEASVLAPGREVFGSESLLGSVNDLMPNSSSQGQLVRPCKAGTERPETFRLSRLERGGGGFGRQVLKQEDRHTGPQPRPCCTQSGDDRVGLLERRGPFQQHILFFASCWKVKVTASVVCFRPSSTPSWQ